MSRASLPSNDELERVLLDDSATDAQRLDYIRRVSQRSAAARCENNHLYCALRQGGPCSWRISDDLQDAGRT